MSWTGSMPNSTHRNDHQSWEKASHYSPGICFKKGGNFKRPVANEEILTIGIHPEQAYREWCRRDHSYSATATDVAALMDSTAG